MDFTGEAGAKDHCCWIENMSVSRLNAFVHEKLQKRLTLFAQC